MSTDDRLEKYRTAKLKSNPVSTDDLDRLFKKATEKTSSFAEKILSTVQMLLALAFLIARARLLADELVIKKMEFQTDSINQEQDDIDTTFDL